MIQVHFDQYNSRVCGDGVHELLEWTDYTDEVESFKKKHIFQTIIDTEIEELSYPIVCCMCYHGNTALYCIVP